MIKAKWMLNGGKSEEEWEALPISTIKLLTAYNFAEESRQVDIISAGVGKAFSPKNKSDGV